MNSLPESHRGQIIDFLLNQWKIIKDYFFKNLTLKNILVRVFMSYSKVPGFNRGDRLLIPASCWYIPWEAMMLVKSLADLDWVPGSPLPTGRWISRWAISFPLFSCLSNRLKFSKKLLIKYITYTIVKMYQNTTGRGQGQAALWHSAVAPPVTVAFCKNAGLLPFLYF